MPEREDEKESIDSTPNTNKDFSVMFKDRPENRDDFKKKIMEFFDSIKVDENTAIGCVIIINQGNKGNSTSFTSVKSSEILPMLIGAKRGFEAFKKSLLDVMRKEIDDAEKEDSFGLFKNQS